MYVLNLRATDTHHDGRRGRRKCVCVCSRLYKPNATQSTRPNMTPTTTTITTITTITTTATTVAVTTATMAADVDAAANRYKHYITANNTVLVNIVKSRTGACRSATLCAPARSWRATGVSSFVLK